MIDPLAPLRLCPAGVADLVRRVREGVQLTLSRRAHEKRARLLRIARAAAVASEEAIVRGVAGEPARVGNARCAARYAHLWGCSIAVAAREFGVGMGAVLGQWSVLYPGDEPRVLDRRGAR